MDFTWAMFNLDLADQLRRTPWDPQDGSTDTPVDSRMLEDPADDGCHRVDPVADEEDTSLDDMVDAAKQEGIGGC